jgi:glycosyltransferase involved in cell wall biosynthesis
MRGAPVAADRGSLPERSLLLLWDQSGLKRGVWLPSDPAAIVGLHPPLVSALMITRCRPRLAAVAIECFRAQTWPRRELVIVDHGASEELGRYVERLGDRRIRHVPLGPSRTPLGTLRNRSLAEARGDWICQWDDDDLSHPARIAMQMAAARAVHADACLLFRETLWRTGRERLAWSGGGLWENSMLARRVSVPEFPPLRRGSDTPVVRAMAGRLPLALLDEPRLYVYIEHGRNLWKADHWDHMWRTASKRAGGRESREWLHALGHVMPVEGTLAAIGALPGKVAR